MFDRGVPEASFEFTSGSLDELTLYEFSKKIYKHYFCPTCGSKLIIAAPSGIFTVNVRSVDDVDMEKLKVKFFDGANLL